MNVACVMAVVLSGSPSATLSAVVEREWRWQLEQFPSFATNVGVHEYDDRLEHVDPATQLKRLEHYRALSKTLAGIRVAGLSVEEQATLAVVAEQTRAAAAAIEVGATLMPMSGDSGFFIDLAQLPQAHEFQTVSDYERYLKRLGEIPRYFDDNLALLREGLARGITLPSVVLKGRDQAARAHAEPKALTASVFYAPFTHFPASIPPGERSRLEALGLAAVKTSVLPAYAKVAGFLAETYLPAARSTIGASDLPQGRAYYQAQMREYLTEERTPEAVHALGLAEVARLRAEMETIRQQVGFAGSLTDFFAFLRKDPQFYAKTPEELLMRASRIAKRIDARLPRFFGVLPRQPYGVEPVPDDIAPFYTGGRYVPGDVTSGKPGTYWVNTYDLPSRPLYVLPALTLHEAVPGHHLQGALAAEQASLPPVRRHAYFSVTGWALYAEFLGEELGIYQTPYERFGRLTYEMWRACRLVVDTGLHAKGWTREQAQAYLRDNTALSLHEVETEVDRYIAWPGQALSYKVGELTIRRLRANAEQALGPRFEVRQFHDTILAAGSVPLPVLEAAVARFIESRRKTDLPPRESP
jgi:uncharacterized protein (DUF885 family)